MTSMTARPDERRVLCCECGNPRTVSARANQRNHLWRGSSPERIKQGASARVASARLYWEHVQPWERHLEDLKCSACGKVTRHAQVPPPGGRDESEEANAAKDVALSLSDDDLKLLVDAACEQLQNCGVKVFDEQQNDREILGHLCRYLDDGIYAVFLNESASPADLLRVIEWAWCEMAESVIQGKWAVAPAHGDEPPCAWRTCTSERAAAFRIPTGR